MPYKRRAPKSRRTERVDQAVWHFMLDLVDWRSEADGVDDLQLFLLDDGDHNGALAKLARELEPELLDAFVFDMDHAGHRPKVWWQYLAPRDKTLMAGTIYAGTFPVARRRVGGVGVPQWEAGLHTFPSFSYGVPTYWLTPMYRDWITKRIPRPDEFVDSDDPPIFESQASYLKRHGLFLPGEHRLLAKADYKSEAITFGSENKCTTL